MSYTQAKSTHSYTALPTLEILL